jgi:cobalamin biosynthesis protein CobD/CbiB
LAFLLWQAHIDHGFLGLIFLLVVVMFLGALSFLVAAVTPGWSAKLAVTVFNGILAFGARMLSDRFLKYLESE